jgi:hypothetical protein
MSSVDRGNEEVIGVKEKVYKAREACDKVRQEEEPERKDRLAHAETP